MPPLARQEPTHESPPAARCYHVAIAARRRAGAEPRPRETSCRAIARRERGDADPECATPQGLSRARAKEGHRARRDHRLFFHDRGHALRPHRDRVFRPILLCSRQIQSAGDRAVCGRDRARLAHLQLGRCGAYWRSGGHARGYPRPGFRLRRSGIHLEPSDPARPVAEEWPRRRQGLSAGLPRRA